MNFGSNAIKYGKTDVQISASVRGKRVRIAVSDRGRGIPLDQQARIFQPFFRAGQETGPIEGTGIGLTITKRIAEMMGGQVGFISSEGGTEFWVELPAHQARESEAPIETPVPSGARRLHNGPGRRWSVLYVEDNPANLALMEEVLQDFERVSLLTAPTAEIGISLAQHHRPDLIILDINLPGMNGFEALRKLRDLPETSPTPVIALSASAMERDVRRAVEAGFSRYLTKPVKVDALIEALGTFLAD
jgi:CheY-like chemotaxis protein